MFPTLGESGFIKSDAGCWLRGGSPRTASAKERGGGAPLGPFAAGKEQGGEENSFAAAGEARGDAISTFSGDISPAEGPAGPKV